MLPTREKALYREKMGTERRRRKEYVDTQERMRVAEETIMTSQ